MSILGRYKQRELLSSHFTFAFHSSEGSFYFETKNIGLNCIPSTVLSLAIIGDYYTSGIFGRPSRLVWDRRSSSSRGSSREVIGRSLGVVGKEIVRVCRGVIADLRGDRRRSTAVAQLSLVPRETRLVEGGTSTCKNIDTDGRLRSVARRYSRGLTRPSGLYSSLNF